MNRFLLKRDDEVIIELSEHSRIEWPIEKLVYDEIEDYCYPYCKYWYCIDAIINDLEHEYSDEDLKRCRECESCSHICFNDDMSKKELEEIREFLKCGNPLSGDAGCFNTETEVKKLLSQDAEDLGEFEDILKCREYIEKECLLDIEEEK